MKLTQYCKSTVLQEKVKIGRVRKSNDACLNRECQYLKRRSAPWQVLNWIIGYCFEPVNRDSELWEIDISQKGFSTNFLLFST